MERKFVDLGTYNPHHIRGIADALTKKYQDLDPRHVFWIAKKLNIYPDAKTYGGKEWAYMTKMGKINKNTGYVADGNRAHLTDSAIKAIEDYLITEGYETYIENKEGKMTETKSIWEQADLISLMKKDYEKAVADRDEYIELATSYEKEIEELKDKLLIAEKENNALKSEKQQLTKMQIEIPNFNKEIDALQQRIGKYNTEINMYSSEVNELRKDISALQTSVNRLQDQKKKLEGVVSDLIGCSKRLMNMK